MFIVHFMLSDKHHWKMFNDYSQAMDFKDYCDKATKIIQFCPTSDKPEIIWDIKWENKAKMPTPLVMPVINSKDFKENEENLILEECVDKVHNLIYGFAEQIRRIGGK